jgi:hypothetical protein
MMPMAAKQADSEILAEIRRLARNTSSVQVTKTVEYDLLAQRLSKADICDEIIDWIDRGEFVKETTLHSFPGHIGQPAYELKPRLNNTLFYIKVALVELDTPGEYMLIISAHPSH